MFKSLGTEFKVGLFTLVAVVTLGYMFFVLSPDAFNSSESKSYNTVLINAAGIIPKTKVQTNGVTVGKVNSVDLEANTTRVTIDVDAEVKIPVGSKITVQTVGLLGDKFLEIVRAEDTGQYIENGGFIPRVEDMFDMNQFMTKVQGIADDIKRITNTFVTVLGGKKGEMSLENIVNNIEGMTADLKKTTDTVRRVIGERDEDLSNIVTDIRATMADLREFSAGLKDVLDVENRERIDRIVATFDESLVDAKSAIKKVDLIVDKVEKGEGTIGRLVNDDNALMELEGAIKDLRSVLAPATKLQVAVDVHGEGRRDKSSQIFFNLKFQTRMDRYYLLGFTDTDNTITDTTTETIPADSDDPAATGTRETVQKEDALKFNLQFAKRWYFLALRFGLFESTGGIGSDFFLFDDRLRLTMEAWDWETTENPIRRTAHVKAYASILFFNHIYILGGVDDITRLDPATGKAQKDPNYFFGAGLTFDDQDLKALFGTAALVL